MLSVVEKFSNYAWVEPLKNKTDKSILIAFAKTLKRGGWRPCFCTRTVVSSSPIGFFKVILRRNRFTFYRHKIKKENLPSPSDLSDRFCLGSGDTSHSKTPKGTSTCFQIFTILQCNISSQHKTKSSPTAIPQATRDCAANRTSLSNSVVKLTARCKQILLATCKIFFATQVLLCLFLSWRCFQVCRYITLDKLLFQICVVVLHSVYVNTRNFFCSLPL